MGTIASIGSAVKVRLDSWSNAWTGLGDALRDKLTQTTFVGRGGRLADSILDDLFHEDDMAARVCEVLPQEMMRAGFEVTVTSDEDGDLERAQDVMARWEELKGAALFTDAQVWARCFGGGGILLGVRDNQQVDQPLMPVEGMEVEFLTVFDKRSLRARQWYDDATHPKHGEVELWEVRTDETTGASTVIHESRLILFHGTRTSSRRRRQNEGWSQSVLERVWGVLKDFNVSWKSVTHVLSGNNQAVYKFKNLPEAMAQGGEETMRKRVELMDTTRSVLNAILIDADEEDFVWRNASLSGYPEILQQFILRLSAAARMPATILFAQSPAGLSATGESDLRWFYDTVAAAQRHELKPQLKQLFELLFLESGPVPEDWDIRFHPLWQPTEKEAAETRQAQAKTDVAYIEFGVLTAEEVALSRFPASGWSPATTVDLELRREMREARVASEEPPTDETEE